MNIIHKVTTARIDISANEARTLAIGLQVLTMLADRATNNPCLSPESVAADWFKEGGSAQVPAVQLLITQFSKLAQS